MTGTRGGQPHLQRHDGAADIQRLQRLQTGRGFTARGGAGGDMGQLPARGDMGNEGAMQYLLQRRHPHRFTRAHHCLVVVLGMDGAVQERHLRSPGMISLLSWLPVAMGQCRVVGFAAEGGLTEAAAWPGKTVVAGG